MIKGIGNKKKNFLVLKRIMNFAIIFFIVIFFLNISLWDVSNSNTTIFNKFGVAVVASDSMEPFLRKNDLAVIKKEDNYKIGDVVVYRNNNELIIHRIVSIDATKIVTMGDANDYEDQPISMNNIYGILNFSIPYIGGIINFFKSNSGIFLVIILIVFLFVYSCKMELKNISNK